MYRTGNNGFVIRLADGAFIPNDLSNRDRAAYETWLAQGGTPEPVPTPDPQAASRVISPRQFIDRLTMERQSAITAAAIASPPILLWLIRLTGALEVDLDNAETIQGVQALASASIITEEEAQALLA